MNITKKQIILTTVILNVLLSVMATDLYLPSLPAITTALHTTHTAVKLTLTFYFIGFCLSQLLYGPLSDAFGRRKIILSGLIISLIGSICCVCAHNISLLLIGRFIEGCGGGAGISLSRAIMRDVFEGKGLSRAASIMSNFTAFVPAAAPIIGGYLQYYFNWRSNFILLFALSAIVAIFIFKYFPETIAEKNRHAIHPVHFGKNYFRLLINRTFMTYCIIAGLMYGTLFIYITFSPFLFQTILHLSPVTFGWLGVFTGAGLLIGSHVNIYLLKKYDMPKIVFIGILITGFAAMLFIISYCFHILNVAVVLIPAIITLLACKLIFSNAFALAMVDLKHMAGTAGALYSMVQMTGPIFTTATASFIHIQTQLPIGLLFLAAFGLMVMVYLFSRRPRESGDPDERNMNS